MDILEDLQREKEKLIIPQEIIFNAFLSSAILAANADGVLKEEEIILTDHLLALFANMFNKSGEQIVKEFKNLLINAIKYGTDELWSNIKKIDSYQLEPETVKILKEAIFVIAITILISDKEVVESEKVFLAKLQMILGITDKRAQEIIDSM